MNLSRAAEGKDSLGDPCKMAKEGYGSHETISVHNPNRYDHESIGDQYGEADEGGSGAVQADHARLLSF